MQEPQSFLRTVSAQGLFVHIASKGMNSINGLVALEAGDFMPHQ